MSPALVTQGALVVVTGASRGIGESIARRFGAGGARVVLVARTGEALERLAAELNGIAVVADLGDPAQVEGLIARIEREANAPVDILVNNAGVDDVGLLTNKQAADVRHIHQVNLIAPIELCRQVLPGMLERGRGHIVNVSSTAACGAFSGLTLYGSTKAGLTNFTAILRVELKGTPIRTTVVSLGPVPSDMLNTINDFEPARRAFTRFRRLQLMPNVDRDAVAIAVVDAVRAGRRHVRLPKRAAIYSMLHEVPRRLVEWTLVGIPSRPR